MVRAKYLVVMIVVVATLISGCGKNDKAKKEAEDSFHQQVAQKWDIVIDSYDLIPMNCDNKIAFKSFSYSHYKELNKLRKFTLTDDQAANFKPGTDEFASSVVYPMRELFDLMSQKVTTDPEQLKDIRAKVTNVTSQLQQYWNDHYRECNLKPVPQRADEIKKNLASIYTEVAPPVANKVIVVTAYPGWINSDVQRRSYSRMADITRRYFVSRRQLESQLNWSYGASSPSYFGYSNVRATLWNAIQLRRALLVETQDAKNVEGMSALSNDLERMLNNSVSSLSALYYNQDYRSFKSINLENNAISARVRRNFGIR